LLADFFRGYSIATERGQRLGMIALGQAAAFRIPDQRVMPVARGRQSE
jgi:hypothetical protein